MANIIIKKSKSVNIVNVSSMPVYRTRDEARAIAKRLRDAGVTPTAPTKTEEGWRVFAKHVGGKLSLNSHR